MALPAFLAVLAVVGLFATWPELAIVASILQVAIPPQYFVIRGGALDSANNAVLLVGVAVWILLRGVNRLSTPVLLAWSWLLLATFIFSSPLPGLGVVQPVKSWFALALGPVLYRLDFPASIRSKLWHSIALLPSLNLAAGVILWAVGVHAMIRVDPGGFARLQGATIPANLALTGFAGVIGGLHGYRQLNEPWLFRMALLNFAIVGLTGTRGAFLASLIVVAAFGLPLIRENFRTGKVSSFSKVFVLAFGAVAIVGVAIPLIVARTLASSTVGDVAINTSGRLLAWLYFWNVATVNLWFGRGLGAGTIANTGDIDSFRVPHNEYLRIVVDGGFIGLIVVGTAFAWLLARLLKSLPSSDRQMTTFVIIAVSLLAFIDNTLTTPQFAVPMWLYLGLLRQETSG